MNIDDDDEYEKSEYEGGHWEWDETNGCLVFISELVKEEDTTTAISVGAINFKDDLDIYEQLRYKKRYQRKTVENDVIKLQDIKDLVIYTTHKSLLTSKIVTILHLPSMERFLRALILYCQYFIQISEVMAQRALQQLFKVRTSLSEEVEAIFRENLEDLRVLVAKEYCLMIKGDGEFVKYHHMGPKKDCMSLLKKDALFFESFLRICLQIVWLALGRYGFGQIETEIHRLFKSDRYNLILHQAQAENLSSSISEIESRVLYGDCGLWRSVEGKLNTHSPFLKEINCTRNVDYRLYGLGVVKYDNLCTRLKYLERLLIDPEKNFKAHNISLGILGLPRSRFDTMLKEIAIGTASGTSVKSQIGRMGRSSSSRKSRASVMRVGKHLVDIIIPKKKPLITIPDVFPKEMYPRLPVVDNIQRKKWIAYVLRLEANVKTRQTST